MHWQYIHTNRDGGALAAAGRAYALLGPTVDTPLTIDKHILWQFTLADVQCSGQYNGPSVQLLRMDSSGSTMATRLGPGWRED